MLTQLPVVVGLTIARDITRGPSGNLNIIETYNGLRVDRFPAAVPPFSILVTLTDGEGSGRLELRVTKLDNPMVEARRLSLPLQLHDRLQQLECLIRITNCVFPSPGIYLLCLFVDDEWIAQRSLRVVLKEP
ncbi:MAG TPA: hypothetical protein VG122_17115 [Gemmata sp.]|nr:hypothetical protein [Gemmata sp.]